jgi:hypothetical protein
VPPDAQAFLPIATGQREKVRLSGVFRHRQDDRKSSKSAIFFNVIDRFLGSVGRRQRPALYVKSFLFNNLPDWHHNSRAGNVLAA